MSAEPDAVVVSPGCDVAAIKARADAATPGPWEADGTEIYRVGVYDDDGALVWIGETCALKPTDDANGEFIAAARTDVPALVAEVERLRAALNAVRSCHTAEKRWHDGSGEWSFDTPEAAADYADGEVDAMTYFDVCGHCADLEARQAGDSFDFLGALWPCPTIKVIDAALGVES